MKPLIGITSELYEDTLSGRPWNSSSLLTSYCSALVEAGAIPVILPHVDDATSREAVSRLDGLILSGGRDIPSEILGEAAHASCEHIPLARWESEQIYLEAALQQDKPVLGICLGMQIMNVAAGGKMIQDIPELVPGAHVHGDETRMHRHEVEVLAGTKLAAIAPSRKVEVTSSHHQAIRDVPTCYRISAMSEDGVVEAIENPDRGFVMGVQWHPERDLFHPNWLLEAFSVYCADAARGR